MSIKTRDELIEAGFKFENHGKCRSCGTEIEWWTTPLGRRAPYCLMPTGSDLAVSHFSDCPDADTYRRPRR